MARSNVGTNTTTRRISRAQSSADGLQPATHRLDLLVTEQRTLVRGTQDSLQQALEKYQTSKSKEEQESARMQVQSLLTRAQELVVTVQVILHIRSEIGHVQQEIRRAKTRHEQTSKLHGRLQWLEKHLEKILLARRRGRPGAHAGRRGQALLPAVHVEGPANVRGIRRRPTEHATLREVASTPSRGDNFSDFDGLSAHGTPWKSESTEVSNARNVPSRSLFSSKHSASRDSDAWHSESEANWTTYMAEPKDITQSQILSEDEPKQSRLTYSPSWSKSEHSVSSPQHEITVDGGIRLQSPLENPPYERCVSLSSSEGGLRLHGMEYKFEPMRPVEVFGECSWNSLSLAVNTNLVKSASAAPQDMVGISMSMLHAGVSDINKDIDSLKKLISDAGQAATNPGPLISGNKTSVHFMLGSRAKSPIKRSASFRTHEGKTALDGISSLNFLDKNECTKISPSRKVYGKQVTRNRSSTYPRVTDVWCKNLSLETEDTVRPLAVTESVTNHSSLIRLSSRILSKRRSRASGTLSRESHYTDKDDIFEREKHQENCIEHLVNQTESPVTDVRKSNVQALGLLPYGGDQVKKCLQDIMISDKTPIVQYEALKSLISLGNINDEVIAFISCCLKGSPELCTDLLLFINQEHIIPHLSRKRDETCPSAIEVLLESLSELLQADDSHLSFHAALLLSQVGLERDKCIELLKKALNESLPEQQSQALTCLMTCCQCTDSEIVCSALQQMKSLHNWKFREQAITSLMRIDKKDLLLAVDETGKSIYDVLLERMPSEAILGVRLTIGKLVMHMGLDLKAINTLIGRLESKSEVIRAEAITALSGFDIHMPKHIRALTECLDLDPSTYVRVQVVKLFGSIKHHNPVILNQLIEKSKGSGPVARECVNVLQRMAKT